MVGSHLRMRGERSIGRNAQQRRCAEEEPRFSVLTTVYLLLCTYYCVPSVLTTVYLLLCTYYCVPTTVYLLLCTYYCVPTTVYLLLCTYYCVPTTSRASVYDLPAVLLRIALERPSDTSLKE